MGIFSNRVKKKTINNPKLKLFNEAGWKGFKEEARLQPSGVQPLIAEFMYSYDDVIQLLVCNKENSNNKTAIRIILKDETLEKLFDSDTSAIGYANKLVKTLSSLSNSKEVGDYCKMNDFYILNI